VCMFNLLPDEQKTAVTSEYRWRLGVVVLCALLVTLVIALVMLVPSFVYSRVTLSQLNDTLERVTREAESKGAEEQADNLEMWQRRVLTLKPHNKPVGYVSESIAEVRELSGEFIAITGVAFAQLEAGAKQSETKTDNNPPERITVSGVAARRQSLFELKTRLENTAEFQDVELPISSFAQDTDIDFTLTLTLRFGDEE